MQNAILICGESGTGKSTSLRNLPEDTSIYLGCDAGKTLPFKSAMKQRIIKDPYVLRDAIDAINLHEKYDIGVIDTLTNLLDMFISLYVMNSPNSQKMWGELYEYFNDIMQQRVAGSEKTFVFLAHTLKQLNDTGDYESCVSVKGSLNKKGIESYFDTVIATKKMRITALEKYKNDLLTITEEEEILGFKYVFQTKLTKETVGERIRTPIGLFTTQETYIDNDVNLVINRIKEFNN